MNRVLLRIWANSGEVVDPDLDPTHPSGEGGAGKYAKGWVVEKEPHEWANFLYQGQTEFQYNLSTTGFLSLQSITYKPLAVGWDADKIVVNVGGTWKESLGNLPYDTVRNSIVSWSGNLASHSQNRENPHQETAEEIGTVAKTGGAFTGTIYFPAGLNVVNNYNSSFKTLPSGKDSWVINLVNRTYGFTTNAGERLSYLDGNGVVSLFLIKDSLQTYEENARQLFTEPTPDAIWPLTKNPYSYYGAGNLSVDGGDDLAVFGDFGLILEWNKTYYLSDLSLLNTGGTVTLLVNRAPVVLKTAQPNLELRTLFGTGSQISDVKVWGYQLTSTQIAAALANRLP